MSTTWGPTAVAADEDDGWEQPGTTCTKTPLDSDGDVVGGRNSVANYTFFRFANVTVPAGATIDSATMSVYVAYATGGAFDVRVYGEASNSPTQIPEGQESADAPSKRDRTTAYVTWAFPQGGDNTYQITGLKDVVQEIVNLGHESGDAMAFIFQSQDASGKYGQVHDQTQANDATLTIEYTEGGGGGSVVPIVMQYYRRLRT